MKTLLALPLLALPLCAADDASSLIKRLIEAERNNNRRAEQYTYRQQTDRFVLDKKDKPRKTQSETHDVIFVEGMRYEKLIARNGKPLNIRDQARVEKDMRQTAEERRRREHPLPAGGIITLSGGYGRDNIDLGSLSELLTLFDNRIAGEEEVRGHPSWVIESTPRANYTPANEHQRQVMIFRKKFWIDKSETVLVRSIYTVTSPDSIFDPGSSLTFESEKIDQYVWEVVSLTLNFSRLRTIYHMSQFKKFDVQSTITVDPAPDANGPPR
ncbi:MAG TPA: hypothetical protein VGL72_31375 [Bryobacteraceae bacterium]